MNFSLTQCMLIHFSHNLFWCSVDPRSDRDSCFNLASCSFNMSPHFSSTYFLVWNDGPGLSCVCPALESAISSKPWFLLMRTVLGASTGVVFSAPLSGQSWWGSLYTNMYLYIHGHIYTCFSLSRHIENTWIHISVSDSHLVLQDSLCSWVSFPFVSLFCPEVSVRKLADTVLEALGYLSVHSMSRLLHCACSLVDTSAHLWGFSPSHSCRPWDPPHPTWAFSSCRESPLLSPALLECIRLPLPTPTFTLRWEFHPFVVPLCQYPSSASRRCPLIQLPLVSHECPKPCSAWTALPACRGADVTHGDTLLAPGGLWCPTLSCARRGAHWPALASVTAFSVMLLLEDVSLEKEMASHSSVLAWRIPWTEGPGKSQWDRKSQWVSKPPPPPFLEDRVIRQQVGCWDELTPTAWRQTTLSSVQFSVRCSYLRCQLWWEDPQATLTSDHVAASWKSWSPLRFSDSLVTHTALLVIKIVLQQRGAKQSHPGEQTHSARSGGPQSCEAPVALSPGSQACVATARRGHGAVPYVVWRCLMWALLAGLAATCLGLQPPLLLDAGRTACDWKPWLSSHSHLTGVASPRPESSSSYTLCYCE